MMKEIKSEKDLVVVTVEYFDGIKRMLQTLADLIEIHDLDAMEQLLYLRKWMDAANVDKEVRKMYPNIQWNNIHLLLPQAGNCCGQCNHQTGNEHSQQ